jgi:hypothetical protein
LSDTGKRPPEFKPVEGKSEIRNLLGEGARTLSSAIIWTKDQSQVIQTNVSVYSITEPALYFAQPKELDVEKFLHDLHKSETRFCFFSVSLPKANIFFKAKFIDFDSAGLKFHVPEQLFTVQRRKDVRLAIPLGYVLKIEFNDPMLAEKTMTKKVIDISATGVSFLAAPNEEIIFQAGIRLKAMTFTIRGRKISVEGEIKHSKPFRARASSAAGLKVGVQFLDILPGESQHIAGYVFEETRKFYSRFL